jgi:hypothetical protein
MVSACQHTGVGAGPNPHELVDAIRSAPEEVTGPDRSSMREVRSLRCRAVDEEPTEFLCRFQVRERAEAWHARFAIVASDGSGWVLLSLD